MTIGCATRLATVGASSSEVASIQAAYNALGPNLQDGVDSLTEAVDNAALSTMLTNWRGGTAFHVALPGVAIANRGVSVRR